MKNSKFQPIIYIMMLSFIIFTQLSCSNYVDLNYDVKSDRSEFAIYIARNPVRYNSNIDYDSIKLDTIKLLETPFLTSDQIESYDTSNHIINLKQSKFDLNYPPSGVYGQMFVVFANDEPVYCGFFWSIISSVPCNWIFIDDPRQQNGLTEKQIRISAGYPNSSFFHGNDPRNDSRIIGVFKNLKKLTGNSLVQGDGLNLYKATITGNDSSGVRINTPLNEFILDSKPFIAYNEILSYDSISHVMTLSIDHARIKSRLDGYFGNFVATLDEKRQYSGTLASYTFSVIIPTITIIQPYFPIDSLKSDQLKISLGYPTAKYFKGDDLRLNKNIVARLKQDKKLK